LFSMFLHIYYKIDYLSLYLSRIFANKMFASLRYSTNFSITKCTFFLSHRIVMNLKTDGMSVVALTQVALTQFTNFT
ncbi:MAG: hypothetical protein WCE95_04060, partial [Nitrososphaeraceae archaeon]